MDAKPARKRSPQAHLRRVRDVDLDKIQRQLFTVLQRETEQLMDLSFRKKLDPIGAKTLVNYLRLLKELRDLEAEALDNLSNEELEELINRKSTTKEKT